MNNEYIVDANKKVDIEYIKHILNSNSSTCVPSMMLLGEPGAGKSSFAKHLAKELDAELIFAPCYDDVNADHLVYNWDLGTLVDAMSDEAVKGRDAMKDGYLLQALKKSITHKVVLLIDEIDKARKSVDTFLLTYLQECMLNDPLTGVVKGNKNNLFIVFTSNEHRELNDALYRRFTLIRRFSFPEENELRHQLKTMITCNYPEVKLNFLIQITYLWRNIKGMSKKPSQNQIADLVNELNAINSMSVGRREGYNLKFRALMFKYSDNDNDYTHFINACHKKFKIDINHSKKLLHYIGSML